MRQTEIQQTANSCHMHQLQREVNKDVCAADSEEAKGTKSLPEASVAHWTKFVGSVPRKAKITACSLLIRWAVV